MNDEDTRQLLKEMNQKLEEINKCFQILGKATADQHILLMRMLATQSSNFAVLRMLLVDDEKLNKEVSAGLKESFLAALKEFESQLVAYDKSHDSMKFLNSFILMDAEPPKKADPSQN